MRTLPFFLFLAACSPTDESTDDSDVGGDTEVEPSATCSDGTPRIPWNADGPFGTARHDLAGPLTAPLADGGTWKLQEAWDGCSSFVFLPDTLDVDDLDPTSVWEADLGALVRGSPPTATYVFVSRKEGPDARASLDAMQERVDKVLGNLGPKDEKLWTGRLLVVDKPVDKLDSWLNDVMDRGMGQLGFAIDRFQHLRGVGSLADVERFDGALQQAERWPWEANLAYALQEVRHFDQEALREQRLAEVNATLVPLWDGELLPEGFAELEVELPSADDLKAFDTLEIDVDMRCPDATKPEIGNCGAWDYIANLFVQEGSGDTAKWVELGRFITTYHRESRWVLDVTPMLAVLKDGGTRRFRWSWAPEWNKQPTITTLSLRLSNQGRGVRPVSATKIFSGGGFGPNYNTEHPAVKVPIPSTAAKVELWSNLTGHGGATNNCAEFCDHRHQLAVDDAAPHELSFPTVGSQDGCVDVVEQQMTPNQWGTWWLGRGGWCPGAPVIPWQVDVTSEVTKGEEAEIVYTANYAGGTIPEGSGNIELWSWLIVYE